MSRILIVFACTDGHTEEVAAYLRSTLQDLGHTAYAIDAGETTGVWLPDFDGVLVGGSVHFGKHQSRLISFVRKHRDELAAMPSAFFSVSMSARNLDDPQKAREATAHIDGFIERTGWTPARIELVAGALPYTRYGFFKRTLVHFIASHDGAGTDTSRDFEYTDWNALGRFATEFAASIADQRERARESSDQAARDDASSEDIVTEHAA